jgi:opacity protein-like surface antigen
MPRAILLFILTGLVFAAPAAAQRAGKSDFYFSPTFTNSQTQTFEGGSSVQTDTGLGLALGWDYNFDAHWAAGIEFNWGQIDYRATVQPGPGNTNAPSRINGTIYTSGLRFNGTYNLASGPLTPFLTANAGWTYLDTGIPDGLPQNVCWYYPWYGTYCSTVVPTKTTTKFSYGLGLGVRADIGRSFVVRGIVSQQYVDFSNYSTTPWIQWRIDLGTRF